MQMLMKLIKALAPWGPVFFAVGFLGPLIAQSMTALEIPGPMGLPALTTGLTIAIVWSLIAKFGGRWI